MPPCAYHLLSCVSGVFCVARCCTLFKCYLSWRVKYSFSSCTFFFYINSLVYECHMQSLCSYSTLGEFVFFFSITTNFCAIYYWCGFCLIWWFFHISGMSPREFFLLYFCFELLYSFPLLLCTIFSTHYVFCNM